VANYFCHSCIGYSAAEEQARANRRSAQPDAQIHNHNYAKMQGMYAEILNHWQKDGGENQDSRGHIHKRANGK
jgi:hypothetical protein